MTLLTYFEYNNWFFARFVLFERADVAAIFMNLGMTLIIIIISQHRCKRANLSIPILIEMLLILIN